MLIKKIIKMRIYKNRSREIFGYAENPVVVYENQFDNFDEELKTLAETPYDEIQHDDLWYYLHDLAYMELQPDLFAYLFPTCLDFWYESLMNNQDAGVGDSEFHYSLLKGNILEKMVNEKQRTAIIDFFIDGFLDKVDLEKNLVQTEITNSIYDHYNQVYRFNSLGYIMPIDNLWDKWWNIDSEGKAISVIKYASALIYESDNNPLFKDGFGPFLAQSDSQIYDESWLKQNIEFLKNTLNPEFILNKLKNANKVLNNSEISQRIYNDSLENKDFIELKIDYLINELSKGESERDTEW